MKVDCKNLNAGPQYMPKEKESALSHSKQNAAWGNFITCNAKLELSWRSWWLGKQRNIPV